MNPLVGPVGLTPVLISLVLLAVLQWRLLRGGGWEPHRSLAVATALVVSWAVAVSVLRFVRGV